MRKAFILLGLLFLQAAPANAQHVSIGIGFPHVNIGINLPLYPRLEPVPGYPVYYAPEVEANFFFYDGMYWVLQGDNWYASSWYNGPWGLVGPDFVPAYLLRVPVRYYRRPPEYFRDWRPGGPPRWGEHWGRDWEEHRRGWEHGNHRPGYRPAPLPVYQRDYAGERYPRVDQQSPLHRDNYRYRPREPVVRDHYQAQRGPQYAGPPGQRGQGKGHGRGGDRGQGRGHHKD